MHFAFSAVRTTASAQPIAMPHNIWENCSPIAESSWFTEVARWV